MSKKKTQPKKRKKKLRVGRLLIVLVLVIGIAAGIGNIYYRSASKAVDPKSQKTVIVEIPNEH